MFKQSGRPDRIASKSFVNLPLTDSARPKMPRVFIPTGVMRMFSFSLPAGRIAAALCFTAIVGHTLPVHAQDDGGDPFMSAPDRSVPTGDVAMTDPTADPNGDKKNTSIYDERAQRVLSREKRVIDKPHPLALEYPEHYVVVCEGGCEKLREQIVYMEPKTARGPVNQEDETVAGISVEAARNIISCVGGCYSGDSTFGAIGGAGLGATADNSWETTVSETGEGSDQTANAKKPTSGRWYDRVGQ